MAPAKSMRLRPAFLPCSGDWQSVSVSLGELVATDPKITTPPTDWQAVTEFGISPSGATVKDGQRVKADGKAWKGPRELRNLRWEGGNYPSRPTSEAAVSPEDFKKNFDGAIKKSLEQEKLEGK